MMHYIIAAALVAVGAYQGYAHDSVHALVGAFLMIVGASLVPSTHEQGGA